MIWIEINTFYLLITLIWLCLRCRWIFSGAILVMNNQKWTDTWLMWQIKSFTGNSTVVIAALGTNRRRVIESQIIGQRVTPPTQWQVWDTSQVKTYWHLSALLLNTIGDSLTSQWQTQCRVKSRQWVWIYLREMPAHQAAAFVLLTWVHRIAAVTPTYHPMPPTGVNTHHLQYHHFRVRTGPPLPCPPCRHLSLLSINLSSTNPITARTTTTTSQITLPSGWYLLLCLILLHIHPRVVLLRAATVTATPAVASTWSHPTDPLVVPLKKRSLSTERAHHRLATPAPDQCTSLTAFMLSTTPPPPPLTHPQLQPLHHPLSVKPLLIIATLGFNTTPDPAPVYTPSLPLDQSTAQLPLSGRSPLLTRLPIRSWCWTSASIRLSSSMIVASSKLNNQLQHWQPFCWILAWGIVCINLL